MLLIGNRHSRIMVLTVSTPRFIVIADSHSSVRAIAFEPKTSAAASDGELHSSMVVSMWMSCCDANCHCRSSASNLRLQLWVTHHRPSRSYGTVAVHRHFGWLHVFGEVYSWSRCCSIVFSSCSCWFLSAVGTAYPEGAHTDRSTDPTE